MLLDLFKLIEALLALFVVIVSIIIALKFISNFYKYNNSNYLYAGIFWIIACEPWIAISFSYILLQTTGMYLPYQLYFLIALGFIPLGLFLWINIVVNLIIGKNIQMKVKIITIISSMTLEVLFIFFLITDPTVIGETQPHSTGQYDWTLYTIIFLIIVLLIFVINGILIAVHSFRSELHDVRLKGKFLVIAMISFLIGASLDAISPFIASPTGDITTIIARIILCFSAINFYWGFFLLKRLRTNK